MKPANHVENRRDRRLAVNQSGKRQAVVIIRERDGKSLPAVFRSEGAALSWIRSRIAKGTVVNADEGTAWNDLHSRFEMRRVNHEQAHQLLSASHPRMADLIARSRRYNIAPAVSIRPFDALAESIAYQQLSGKAAATIFGRVRGLYPKTKWLDPAKILATPDDALRSAGLSRAKTAAIKDLAAKTIDGTVPSGRALLRMSDDEIIARLTQVRGIGRWTVEMLLLFDLGRPDVWPVDDYGVRKGFAKTFGRRKLPTPKQLIKSGEKWRPYRSVAAWYFWRALEAPEKLRT